MILYELVGLTHSCNTLPKFTTDVATPFFASFRFDVFGILGWKAKMLFKILLFESSSGNNSASSTILTPLIFTNRRINFYALLCVP